MSFWTQLIIENLNIMKSQYTEISIIACMKSLNWIMYIWVQSLILTQLCKGTISLICVSAFLPQIYNFKNRKTNTMSTNFLPQYSFQRIVPLSLSVRSSRRAGRKEKRQRKWNTVISNMASICVPYLPYPSSSSLKYLILNYKLLSTGKNSLVSFLLVI